MGELTSKMMATLLFILNIILSIFEAKSRPINLNTLIGVILVIIILSIIIKAIKEIILGRYHYFEYFYLTLALVSIILAILSLELIITPPFCYPTSLF